MYTSTYNSNTFLFFSGERSLGKSEYFEKSGADADHLGNVRLSYKSDGTLDPSTGEYNIDIVQDNAYYPFGMKIKGVNTTNNHQNFKYSYNGQERQDEFDLNIIAMDYRQYDPAIGRFNCIDRLTELIPNITPYRFAFNNPNVFSDPTGLIEKSVLDEIYDRSKDDAKTVWNNDDNGAFVTEDGGYVGHTSEDTSFNRSPGEVTMLSGITVTSGSKNHNGAVNQIQSQVYNTRWYRDNKSSVGFGGNILTGTDKHFNGSLGTIGIAIQGYGNIPNNVKRHYAYKLSKATNLKSGKIFQGMKSFSKSAGKVVGKLGPVGTALGVGTILYEGSTNTWDAHTLVNGGLIVAGVAASIFASPAVLTGIAVYGVADYFFDISGAIDSTVGRNSGVWEP